MKGYLVPSRVYADFGSLAIGGDAFSGAGRYLLLPDKQGDGFSFVIIPVIPPGYASVNASRWGGNYELYRDAQSDALCIYNVLDGAVLATFTLDDMAYDKIIVSNGLCFVRYPNATGLYNPVSGLYYKFAVLNASPIGVCEGVVLVKGDSAEADSERMVFAYNLEDGHEVWRLKTGRLAYSFIAAEQQVLVLSRWMVGRIGNIEIVDIADSATRYRWSCEEMLATDSSMAMHGGRLYVLTINDLYGIDWVNNEVRRFGLEAGHGYCELAIVDDIVILQGDTARREKNEALVQGLLAVYELSSGALLSRRVLEGVKSWGTPSALIDNKLYCFFMLAGYRFGTDYQYMIQATLAELKDPATPLVMEQPSYRIERELDKKGFSSYRISVAEPVDFVRLMMQLEIGAATCTFQHAMLADRSSDSYPDEDFAGEIVLDCGERILSAEERHALDDAILRLTDQVKTFRWKDAIRNKPVRYRLQCLEVS